MNWWNVSVFGLIPIFSLVLLFCFNRKFLWSAPIVSIILAIVVSGIWSLTTLNSLELLIGDHSNLFWFMIIPTNFLISSVITVITYGISTLSKNKQHK